VTKRNTVGTQHVTKIHTQMYLHTAQGPQHAEEYSVNHTLLVYTSKLIRSVL